MRKVTNINSDWIFVDPRTQKAENVVIPHTWNAVDGQDGGNDYYRGKCFYAKELDASEFSGSDEYYIQFDAVFSSAEVYFN